jgi:spore maturation protein CgeB
MRLVIFGLTVTSSWGNGHATLWRGLIKALGRRGWDVTFYERDVPYYRDTRDRHSLEGGELRLYENWSDVLSEARGALAEADAAIITSYCPDGVSAARLVADSARGIKVFYDLDTPVTLAQMARGEHVEYVPPEGLGGFDLVLSYTGGRALSELKTRLGARRTAPLYGHVDPDVHRPGRPAAPFLSDLSYIGTYAQSRQRAVEEFFVEPARRRPDLRFTIAGAQYPADFPWTANIHFVRHLPAEDHPDFYASSRLTLNVTRFDMAAYGWCPSGRLFEAAGCGAAIATDVWPGLESFFTPGREVIPVCTSEDVLAALSLGGEELHRIARHARERVLAEHTSAHRAAELEGLLSAVPIGTRVMEGA